MFKDEELISRIISGELKAFELLVKQYEKLVFHVIRRMVPEQDDAEDICQEVFIKVHLNIGKFAFQSKLSTWIARIAYLSAVNHLRKYAGKQAASYTPELDNYHFTGEDPEYLMIKKDAAAYINHLLAKMPEQYRVLLTLYHLEEFSYLEIGEITQLPEGTVKNYLFRARKLLRERLEEYLKNEIV